MPVIFPFYYYASEHVHTIATCLLTPKAVPEPPGQSQAQRVRRAAQKQRYFAAMEKLFQTSAMTDALVVTKSQFGGAVLSVDADKMAKIDFAAGEQSAENIVISVIRLSRYLKAMIISQFDVFCSK
jgi:hypothetical protein